MSMAVKGRDYMKKTELLVPVKNMKCLEIAIQCGADSIYVGYPVYNARWKGQNFSTEALKDVVKYAHENEVKVYLTLNALIKEQEFEDVLKYVEQAVSDHVDAIIIQDLGLARYIHKNYSQINIHASTQTTVANHYGVQVLEKIGFNRVVLARELNVDEIVQIQELSPIEIEIFLHGGLCIAYSGQCFMSGYVFGLAANRGMCEALCCDTYAMYKNSTQMGYEKFLKPRDLWGIECLEDLLHGGVRCFKIQGRTRSEEYLSQVVEVYKRYLKKYDDGECYLESLGDKARLKNAYNRGVSSGNLGMIGNTRLIVEEIGNKKDFIVASEQKEDISFKIETGKKCNMGTHILLQKINLRYDYSNLSEKIERLYIPLEYFLDESYYQLIEYFCQKYGVCVYMPRMIYERNCQKWYNDLDAVIIKFNIKGIVVSNISDLAMIERYKELNLEFIGNYSLNITNHYTADYLKEIGIKMVTLSVEMNPEECNLLSSKTEIQTGIVGYGHIPLMSMKYCLITKCNECLEECTKPCKQGDIYTLVGKEEYLVDINSRQTTTMLYSKKVFYQPLSNCNAYFFRADFYNETVSQMNEIIRDIKNGCYCIGRNFKNYWNVQ